MHQDVRGLVLLNAWKFRIYAEVLAHILGLPYIYRLPSVQVGLLGYDEVGGKFPELRADFMDVVNIDLPRVTPPVYLLRKTEVFHTSFTRLF